MTAIRRLALALLLSVNAPAAGAESGPLPLQRVALGELGGLIELAVTVDGRAGRWLLDTGASRNLVSPDLARRLGLSPSGNVLAETPLGQVQGGEVELPPLRVGGLERTAQRALVVELGRLFGDIAEGFDGVLGVPWLDGVQLDLDLRAWSAAVRAGGEADCPPGLSAVALARHRTLPVLTLGVGPASERYVLDTGNPAGLIRIEAEAPTAATPGLAVPGNMRLTLLREATLGPQRRSDVPVTRLTAAPVKKAFDGAVLGLAGTAFIDGARWRLDLARGQLCVEPGRFATPGGFGLTLVRQGEALRIGLVLPGSPAEQAGLRAGERLTGWAGLPASQPLSALWLAVQGRDEVAVTAGEPARTVTLKRALFAPSAGP